MPMDTHKRRAADGETPWLAGDLAGGQGFLGNAGPFPPTSPAFEHHPVQSCAAITPSLQDTHFDVPPAGPIRDVRALASLRSCLRLETQCTPDSHCIRAGPGGVSSA